MRFVRVLFALVFGLALAGPETHACPVHSAHSTSTPAPAAHHESTHEEQPSEGGSCTCPQACCPIGVGVSLPARAQAWIVAPAPVFAALPIEPIRVVLPSRTHLLPFALAPPLALA